MSLPLPDLNNMPAGLKLGVAAGGGGGAVAAGYGLWKYDLLWVLWTVLIAIVFVGLLLLAWKWLAQKRQQGQAKVFGEGLGAQFRRTPGQVTDADSRAKLDDLRRKLQEGFGKLSSAGKSPYVLPWYLMVGEPGSGKTKAIAAASIALPGFQDPLQGAGGTVNMNWWFTNNGIILDTAGRLMLPEVATSNNPEWDEFLNTLNQQRGNCPINGLVLAIPADTLVTDDESRIAKKAGEIAYQFNKVQATLGIRFPVFVLITKCDKVLGFREFFESVTNPDEQAQMLGWSNPEKLDDPFRPELVEQHLQKVHEQLRRRRLRLLQNPLNTDDPAARRLDQVDALYELPDALLAVGPRLRRYLEAIFVAGPLSSKPLFLRGIYFTSSLQTGEALDKAISAIMGVDIAATHGEPIVSEKPYFLRHVFMEKAFKEKGLVTRTSNISQLKRGRRLRLMGAGFAAAAALLGVTWIGYYQLQKGIVVHQKYWSNVNDTAPGLLNVIADKDGHYAYQGGGTTADKSSVLDLYNRAPRDIAEPIRVPLVFKPVSVFTANPDNQRRVAFRQLFESRVLLPLINAARSKVRSEKAETWSPTESTPALRELILLAAGARPDPAADTTPVGVLGDYVLAGGERAKFDADRPAWDKIFQWLYSPGSDGGRAPWPPPMLADARDNQALQIGLDEFLAWCDSRSRDAAHARRAAQDVTKSLKLFDEAEQAILRINLDQRDSWADAAAPQIDLWKSIFPKLADAKGQLDTALAEAISAGWKQQSGVSLAQFYQDAVRDADKTQRAECGQLVAAAGQNQKASLEPIRQRLNERLRQIKAEQDTVAADDVSTYLNGPGAALLAPAQGNPGPLQYEARFAVLSVADGQVPGEGGAANASSSGVFSQDIARLDQGLQTALDQVRHRSAGFPAGGTESKLAVKADAVIDVAGRRRRYLLLDAALKSRPGNVAGWQSLVQQQTPSSVDTGNVAIPLTALENARPFPLPEFDPARFQAVQTQWSAVAHYCNPVAGAPSPGALMDAPDLQSRFRRQNQSWTAFENSYAGYWRKTVPEQLKVAQLPWSQFYPRLKALDPKQANQSLGALSKLQADALQSLDPASSKPAAVADPPDLADLCGRCRANWLQLGPNVMDARAALLATPAADFAKAYLLHPSASPTLAEMYWDQVFRAAFTSLGDAAAQQADADLGTLVAQYRKFPLAPPGPNGEELNSGELAVARALIDSICGSTPQSDPQNPLLASATLSPDLDDALRKLRGETSIEKLRGAAAWVKRVRPLVDALADNKLACRITFENDQNGGISSVWFYVAVLQKNVVANETSLRDPGMAPKGGVPVQIGGDLVLKFTDNADKKNYRNPQVIGAGPWAGLRLLTGKAGTVVPDPTDPAAWLVTDSVKDQSGEHSLTFQVKYTGALTDLKDLVKYWDKTP